MPSIKKYREPRNAADVARILRLLILDQLNVATGGSVLADGPDIELVLENGDVVHIHVAGSEERLTASQEATR